MKTICALVWYIIINQQIKNMSHLRVKTEYQVSGIYQLIVDEIKNQLN